MCATIEHVPRADGRLGHDLIPGEKAPQDACGVFGVWAPGEEVAKLTYFGLYALQHRGQESAGIATSDGEKILVFKDMGLVSQVFDEAALTSLTGHIAIGHTRYSTSGRSTWENAQPTLGPTVGGDTVALAHNGNITNTDELAKELAARQHRARAKTESKPTKSKQKPANASPSGTNGASVSTSDTGILTGLLAGDLEHSLEQTARSLLANVEGAFSLVFMDENTLYAARDRHGVRPLSLGRLEKGWVVASETAALDIVGATYVRDILPGEMVAIDSKGLRSSRFAAAKPSGCIFEFVYLSRPDTIIAGQLINQSRLAMGRTLAKEHPVEADLVIPVPSSGTPAAIGYAAQSGIEFAQGLTKNAYVGRTFIRPSQTIRQLGIRLKLNPLGAVVKGKRLIVVDDSIVRGNTQRAVIRMLRQAGAAEVHVRISSPPVIWPCFYGIDFATRAELIAPGLGVDEICKSIEADSLGYISIKGLVEATGLPGGEQCAACFTGRYPIRIPPWALDEGKELQDGAVLETSAQRPDGLAQSTPGGGAGEALDHP
ncbi:MAG: amidophosphoribosyltransferase [Micrococcales bacterium]|nr:amidophosphoribosyltransferase [Micrococcales bacterium]